MELSDVTVLLIFLAAIVKLMSSIVDLAKLLIEKMILDKIKIMSLKNGSFLYLL